MLGNTAFGISVLSISGFIPCMPTPNKGYKAINHNDVLYRWILQNQRGVNEMVVIASETVNGRKLLVTLPRVVNLELIPKAIDFALEHGWKPMEAGDPFLCTWRRGQFIFGGE